MVDGGWPQTALCLLEPSGVSLSERRSISAQSITDIVHLKPAQENEFLLDLVKPNTVMLKNKLYVGIRYFFGISNLNHDKALKTFPYQRAFCV